MLRLFTESRLPPHLCHKPPILRSTAKVSRDAGPSACPALGPAGHHVWSCPAPWTEPAWEEPRAADLLGPGRESPFTAREGRSRGQSGVHTGGGRRAGLPGHWGQRGPRPGLGTSLSPQQTLLSRRGHGERYPSQTVSVLRSLNPLPLLASAGTRHYSDNGGSLLSC